MPLKKVNVHTTFLLSSTKSYDLFCKYLIRSEKGIKIVGARVGVSGNGSGTELENTFLTETSMKPCPSLESGMTKSIDILPSNTFFSATDRLTAMSGIEMLTLPKPSLSALIAYDPDPVKLYIGCTVEYWNTLPDELKPQWRLGSPRAHAFVSVNIPKSNVEFRNVVMNEKLLDINTGSANALRIQPIL
jgi:hypothetical protein